MCGEKKKQTCAGRDKDRDREHAHHAPDHPCSNEIPKLNQKWILFFAFPSGGVVVSSSDNTATFENLEMVRNKNWIWRCVEYVGDSSEVLEFICQNFNFLKILFRVFDKCISSDRLKIHT